MSYELETITITLDGRVVSGHAGMTILEVARESGVNIPTLCHAPNLTSVGACRICLVEDERSGALMASCVTPIAQGMMINTSSPRVLERRRVIVKLMLASHPDSCLVCDKGNRCDLRQIAANMGIGLVDYQRIPQLATIEEVNPFIERDLSKCILCGKCVRADLELVVEGAIDYTYRGFAARPATLSDAPLEKSECTFCGTCVALCPTGALMEKERIYRGTTATSVSTTCPLCGCGCSICLEVKGDRIVRARPGAEVGVNHGALCVRGTYGYDFVHSSERLTKPLARVNGDLVEVSWAQALDIAASGFDHVKGVNGPDSLAVLGSSKCTNEENYLLQRFARAVLRTNNIDNGSRLYSSANRIGLGWTLGLPGSTGSLDDLERSQVIMVIGANPLSSAPAVGYAIKRAVAYKGAKLLLVDPRQTKISSFAEQWLRPRIGSDVALINGFARVIIDEGLLDEEFVTRSTDNFEAFSTGLAAYSAEYVEEITGVAAESLHRAAHLFAEAKQASIIFGSGITQCVMGSDNVTALANLAMLTGNIGRRGGGIYALQRDANGQGACDVGALPDFLPGYQSLDNLHAKNRFADRWGAPLPARSGLTALEMIEQAHEGKIKGMYIVGENPALGFPHLARVREALASLDYLVVQDMFLTETARLATVVFPAASFAEKEGSFTNFEGRIQRLRRAIEPPGESLPDWEIILRLAKKMGCPMPYSSLQEIMDEIEELVPLYQDIGYARPDGKEAYQSRLDNNPFGTRRLFRGQFPHGFGRFSPVQYTPQRATPQDGYHLTLLAVSTLHQFGSGSRSSRAPRLRRFQPEALLEISVADGRNLGIANDDRVKVTSPAGEIAAIARISDAVPEGMLLMPASFPSSPVGELFTIALDPRAKTPSLKTCAVRLQRIDPNG